MSAIMIASYAFENLSLRGHEQFRVQLMRYPMQRRLLSGFFASNRGDAWPNGNEKVNGKYPYKSKNSEVRYYF
jgi:hypothetical protein